MLEVEEDTGLVEVSIVEVLAVELIDDADEPIVIELELTKLLAGSDDVELKAIVVVEVVHVLYIDESVEVLVDKDVCNDVNKIEDDKLLVSFVEL